MNAERVECQDCGATFPERYRWEPSLPPHNCTERHFRRLAERAAEASKEGQR